MRCLAFPRGSSLVWPPQCWQEQFRGIQRLGQMGMGKSSTAPPSAGGDWQPWTQPCPGIMDLVIKAWYFCSLGCEVLSWAEPSPRWVCCSRSHRKNTLQDIHGEHWNFLALPAAVLSFNFMPLSQQGCLLGIHFSEGSNDILCLPFYLHTL